MGTSLDIDNIIVVGVMKMGNIVPTVGIEPTSLAFRVSVLPLNHIGYLVSTLYPRLPVYAASCLRGQCRPLHYCALCIYSRHESMR